MNPPKRLRVPQNEASGGEEEEEEEEEEGSGCGVQIVSGQMEVCGKPWMPSSAVSTSLSLRMQKFKFSSGQVLSASKVAIHACDLFFVHVFLCKTCLCRKTTRNTKTLIGCKVQRLPEGSTERYTRWINTITQDQLTTQVYTSHGPTVIMPTWFCSKSWFLKVGWFDEGGKGVPEDLLFFYHSIRQGGGVARVDQCLLVKAFCDVDENKIQKGFYTYEESKQRPKPKIPILHYKDASAPFIICVKLDMTGGVLEENLNSLQLKEGKDYYHFN
ncbi:UDP-GlcNAc:betaGal beta-1,3-N-acetylglucosaminyltransferase-like protein 1 [Larimichthys crocea]|uniref:Uncharacterized protein n=1 Tax=Larimichthys crocea TaxID=215358 RepID=A0ACD3RV92_LARCR|nr:UDP-GlcNAc:betaGal beta-1,3-N-acetylglucosaminyltransferase-like protein 1 [Larimichthys crocea]